jgi:hypothetical protein
MILARATILRQEGRLDKAREFSGPDFSVVNMRLGLPVGDPQIVVLEDGAAELFFGHEGPAAVPQTVADDVGRLTPVLEDDADVEDEDVAVPIETAAERAVRLFLDFFFDFPENRI